MRGNEYYLQNETIRKMKEILYAISVPSLSMVLFYYQYSICFRLLAMAVALEEFMALIKCPDCEREISSRALQCPFCGCPAEFFNEGIEVIGKESSNNTAIVEPAKSIISSSESDVENNKKEDEPDVNTRVLRQRLTNTLKKYAETRNNKKDSIEESRKQNELSVGQVGQFNGEEIKFGLRNECYHDNSKYSFAVIQDPERETDNFANGMTHVLFRLGKDKYIPVSKSDLFYAPVDEESYKKIKEQYSSFKEYIDAVTDLKGLTEGASDIANLRLSELMDYYVEKMVSYGIFEYDFDNFSSECGGDVLLSNSDSFCSIMEQINAVSDYADNLAYQRDVERASRSRWQGGGFGLGGAIKGAITAGALNAATGAFRSIGDSMTDSGDRNDINKKLNSIVNENNKNALSKDFMRCLLYARKAFMSILHRKTGWDANGVMQTNREEYSAKLRNIDVIRDKSAKEQVFFELLSEYAFDNEMIKYALSHYDEYGLDVGDLLHYVRRMNPDTCNSWLKYDLSEKLLSYVINLKGNERISAIMSTGLAFDVIDEDFHIKNPEVGVNAILFLIVAEMNDKGYDLLDIESFFKNANYTQMEGFINNLRIIGYKYHVIADEEIKKKVKLIGNSASYEAFAKLKSNVENQLNTYCTVNKVECGSIPEAKQLKEEWDKFNSIYKKYESYADYDSSEMKKVLDKMKECGFKSKHILELVEALNTRKNELEAHEIRPEYAKSQQIIKRFQEKSDGKLVAYGTDGFLDKARRVLSLGDINRFEGEFYPCVIYDGSDSSSFKGFVITENYYYNYNPFLLGTGEKEIQLANVKGTAAKGKNRIFFLKDGRSEKIKIINHETLVIDALSDVYGWEGNRTQETNSQDNTQRTQNSGEKERNPNSGNLGNTKIERVCTNCGKTISMNAKFCKFCGNQIDCNTDNIEQDDSKVEVEKPQMKQCPNCKKIVRQEVKFCVYCGRSFI